MSDTKRARSLPQITPAGTELVVVLENPNASGPLAAATTQGIANLALTGSSTVTQHRVLVGAASSKIASLGAGTNGQTLTGVTGSDPTWQTIQAATATDAASVRSACVHYTAPVAANLTAGGCTIITNIDVANGAQSVAAQPDFPRKLLLFVTDANSSISAGTLDLVGVGPSGEAATESIALTGGTASHTSTKAYATLTSATVTGLVGAAAGDKIALGVASALGLPGQKTPASSAFTVYKADVDGANETVGTVDATAGTIIPTTAPDAAHNYDFWFNFTVTELQNSHTHTFA